MKKEGFVVIFLADENIPLEVVEKLRNDGFSIISASESHRGIDDESLLEVARQQERVLVTMDKDFGELIFRRRLESRGVIFLRIHPQSAEFIYSLLKKVMQCKVDFPESFCVVEKHKLRIMPLIKN